MRTFCNTKRYVIEGNKQFDAGNFKKAIELYNKAIFKQKKKHYSLIYKRGNAYLLSGNFANAIADYSKVISANRKYIENLVDFAHRNYTAKALRGRSEAYYQIGEIGKALADWVNCVGKLMVGEDTDEIIASVYVTAAKCYYHECHLERAFEYLGISLKALETAEAYIVRGAWYFERGEEEKALADFKKVYEFEPLSAAERCYINALDLSAYWCYIEAGNDWGLGLTPEAEARFSDWLDSVLTEPHANMA